MSRKPRVDSGSGADYLRHVNLVLFAPEETAAPLPLADPRARHVVEILRRTAGDTFDAGLIGGPRGQARITAIDERALHLDFTWGPPLPALPARTLLVGLPRPQTARDILRDATTLGATALHFVVTERSEPGYAQSSLWRSGEWRRHVLAGAAQAFDPRVPEVTHGVSLRETLAALPAGPARVALDNYEATAAFGAAVRACVAAPLVLALGPERGWGARDRELLRTHGFTLAHLGARVLRLETAVVAALAITQSAAP